MRSRWVMVGLVLFVAADVVLVALTFRHVDPPPPPVSTAASRSASPTPGSTPGSTPEPTPAPTSGAGSPAATPATPDEVPPPGPASGPVAFLSVGADGAVLRTSRGDCPGSGQPTVTVAAGLEERPSTARVPGLRTVLAAQATSRRDLTIVGLNRRCRANLFSSDDGGRTWSRREGDPGRWRLAADRTSPSVFTPNGRLHTPCRPRALSAIDGATARVLCDDGQVLGTEDQSVWVTLGRLAGAVDIGYDDPADAVALATDRRCRAAVMQTSDGGTAWTRLVCLPGRRPRAVGVRGALVAAQVGNHLYASTDSGGTWRDLHWDE
jgi:hypothetical protein